MEASHKRLIFHCEVRWLSRGRVLSRVFELKKELGAFFLVQLWHVPEYKKLAEKAISLLIQSQSTYLCESGFSTLSQIKTKQGNSIEKIDQLRRGALETELVPRYDQLVGKLQNQKSH